MIWGGSALRDMEWSGVEWSRVEWSGVVWCEVELNGIGQKGELAFGNRVEPLSMSTSHFVDTFSELYM